MNPFPDQFVLTGDPEEDSIAGMVSVLQWEIWGWYARYQNNEISEKEYKEAIEPLQKKIDDIKKITNK